MKIYAIIDFDEDLGVCRAYHFKNIDHAKPFFESNMWLWRYGTEIDEYEFLDEHGTPISESSCKAKEVGLENILNDIVIRDLDYEEGSGETINTKYYYAKYGSLINFTIQVT